MPNEKTQIDSSREPAQPAGLTEALDPGQTLRSSRTRPGTQFVGTPAGSAPPSARAAHVLAFPAPGGAARRAHLARALQSSVGNARLNRMLGTGGAPMFGNAGALPSGSGRPLDRGPLADMENSFGADLSGIRVHTGPEAASAAHDLNAKAFTYDQDIYFAAGQYQPDTATGRRLLAHEVVHTLQTPQSVQAAPAGEVTVSQPDDPMEREAEEISRQVEEGRPAAAPQPVISQTPPGIARDAEPQPYDTSSASEKPLIGIRAQDWVALHSANLVGQIGHSLSKANLAIPTPYVSWKDGQESQFLIDFWAPFWGAKNNPWSLFTATLVPDKPEKAADAGRDAYPWDIGTLDWRDAVVGEFYKLYMKRLQESLARLLPRWRNVKNQLALRAEAGDAAADRDPASDEISASHPVDRHVLGALPGKLKVDVTEFRKAYPDEAKQREIRSGLRGITYDFEIESGAWNWVYVKSPPDATSEEVAKALYGNEEKAYLLTAAAPLFGFPDVYDLVPAAREKYNEQRKKSSASPTLVPGSQEPTPGHQILLGPLAEEAALRQAAKIKPTPGASASAVLDRMRLIVRTLRRMAGEYKKLSMAGGSTGGFEGVEQRVDKRSARLASAPPPEVLEWDAQTRGQLEILNAAESGLAMAKQQEGAFAGWPAVNNVAYQIAGAYARAAQASELVDLGRWWLNFADEQSRLFPVTLMDLLLAELRRAIAAAKPEKTGVISAEMHQSLLDIPELEQKETKLRAALVKVRDIVLQHPERAKEALQPLFKEIEDLQVQVTLVTNIDQCDRAWRALMDSTSVVGEMRAVWDGGNEIVRDAIHATNQLNSEWRAIYLEWKFGDKQKAKNDLQAKSKSPEWAGFMERVRKVITDQATYDKWMTFALMVGIAVLTAGIGAYVEAAAGAAWGATAGFVASTVVEAATFTTLSYGLITKDPSVSGFFHEFGKGVLTFGALKIISRVYRIGVGAEAAASVEGKVGEVLTQFVALNGLALYEADQEKRKKTGQGLTMGEIGDISLNNLAFIAAVSVGNSLAKRWITSLRLTGELQGNLAKIESTRLQLLDMAKSVQAVHGKNPALARRMLAKQAELVALQERTLMRLEQIAKDPKAAKAAGVTPEQAKKIAAAEGEITAALEQIQQAHIAMELEPVGPNDFLCPKGQFFDGLRDFFVKKQGASVSEKLPADPVTQARTMEVTPKDGTPFRVTERTAAKAGEVSAGVEMRPEGDPSGGRYGYGPGAWEQLLNDPHPTAEVADIQKRLKVPENDYAWRHPTLARSLVRPELAKLRLSLVSRRAAEVPQVTKVLRAAGIRGATPEMVDAVFRYNFDSASLAFTYENYAAWSRLASGKGTVGDLRYIVHEIAEIKEFQRTRVDFMGEKLQVGTPEHAEWFEKVFEPAYLKAHSKALFAEYRFLAAQIAQSTGGRIKLSPPEVAAFDTTNLEARDYMMLPGKGGAAEHPVSADPSFQTWQAKGQIEVQLEPVEAKRLGSPEKTTAAALLSKIKGAKLP